MNTTRQSVIPTRNIFTMKRKIFLAVLLFFCGTAFMLLRPTLFVVAKDALFYAGSANEGTKITVNFIHSVQKTPVEENLVVNGRGFLLKSTRYQSFGVGLPFLASEGNFRREGDFFVMDDMNRFYPSVSLRIGVDTNLTVTVGDTKLNLYDEFPVGTAVDIFIAPYAYGVFRLR